LETGYSDPKKTSTQRVGKKSPFPHFSPRVGGDLSPQELVAT